MADSVVFIRSLKFGDTFEYLYTNSLSSVWKHAVVIERHKNYLVIRTFHDEFDSVNYVDIVSQSSLCAPKGTHLNWGGGPDFEYDSDEDSGEHAPDF